MKYTVISQDHYIAMLYLSHLYHHTKKTFKAPQQNCKDFSIYYLQEKMSGASITMYSKILGGPVTHRSISVSWTYCLSSVFHPGCQLYHSRVGHSVPKPSSSSPLLTVAVAYCFTLKKGPPIVLQLYRCSISRSRRRICSPSWSPQSHCHAIRPTSSPDLTATPSVPRCLPNTLPCLLSHAIESPSS